MQRLVGIFLLLTVLQVHVNWAIECYDCDWQATSGRRDCGAPGYGSAFGCPLQSQLYCKIVFGDGYAQERACADTCTDTYNPTGNNGNPDGTYCCQTDACNTLPPAPVSGLSCYACDSTTSCDDTGGQYGLNVACLEGENLCQAHFALDKPYKRACAASCDAEDLYKHDDRGRNGVYCCDTELCNGPGGPKEDSAGPKEDSASGVHATLVLILAALVLETMLF